MARRRPSSVVLEPLNYNRGPAAFIHSFPFRAVVRMRLCMSGVLVESRRSRDAWRTTKMSHGRAFQSQSLQMNVRKLLGARQGRLNDRIRGEIGSTIAGR